MLETSRGYHQVPGFGRPYDTVEDAAAAALMWLSRQPRAVQREYMGLLLQDPATGKFRRTEFQTDNSRDSSSWTGFPDGQIAGIVHNHPLPIRAADKYSPTTFSEQDVQTAQQLGVPSFVAAMTDKNRAADVMLDPSNIPPGLGRRAGQSFLAQFPIEEFKQALMREILKRQPNDPRGLLLEDPLDSALNESLASTEAQDAEQKRARVIAQRRKQRQRQL